MTKWKRRMSQALQWIPLGLHERRAPSNQNRYAATSVAGGACVALASSSRLEARIAHHAANRFARTAR
jgi:hypothetical protein